ncbi:MAG: sigma-70 family RNA polymerase sigma factor [Candidatus Promineifilaceae bacterium]|nr:sigma-70 family RNA polymerase sigma factor [Candidatus Promineifilaceae bacterium]
MSDAYDEAALIARLQRGDKEACAECIEIHSPAIYRLALRLMGNEAEAEDVMQETFMSAFKAIESFEGRSGLGTWLYRIAYNAAMMRLRRKQPYQVSVESALNYEENFTVPRQLFDWCCLPERDFEREEVRQELEQAIRELPESLRVVFLMRELEGLSTADTAAALELSEGAVKVRLHRARLWLRERLAPFFTALARDGREVMSNA